MSSTTFTKGITAIQASWLNDVNAVTYGPFGGPVRPTATVQWQMWVDAVLGQPIWCSSLNAPQTWINSAGVTV